MMTKTCGLDILWDDADDRYQLLYIIAHFDEGISNFYEAKDLENGYIETRNRAGQLERINIMSISIIVMYSDEIRSTPVNEVYKRMMLYKKRAKMVRGSVLLKDFN